MSGNSSSRIIRFSTFEADLQTGELRRRGQQIKLQEQPFQVLTLLLERPGEVVTREELRSKLWSADTFVDFDHGLNAAIKRLRDALGDSADTPIFIETLARRGYRFIAPINNGSVPSGVGIAIIPKPGKSFFLQHWIAIASVLSIMIGGMLWRLWPSPSKPLEIAEHRLTANSLDNSVNSAAISPDGKHLAYTDNTGMYLKLIRTGETHTVPLPRDFFARVDDWFPDGAHLLVTRGEQPGKMSLWSISVFGGAPRQLADDASHGSLSPDGAHIAFCRVHLSYDVQLGREVWVMRSDGTDPVKVADRQSSRVGGPTWSPDGRRVAYVRTEWAYNAPTRSVELNEWQSATAETLFSDSRLGPAVRWLPDGRLIYALGTQQSSMRQDSALWAVSMTRSKKRPAAPKRITQGNGSITQMTGSADGRVLSFLRENWSPSVYIGTPAADGEQLLAHRRLTFDDSVNVPFAWTPDSKAVLLNSDRNGNPEILKQAIDQPLAETLVSSTDLVSQPRITPDGSEILYISTPKSASPETLTSIFAIPIGGGIPRLVLKDFGIYTVQCARLPSTICMYGVAKGDTWKAFQFDVGTGRTIGHPQIDPPCNWSLSPDGSQRATIVCRPNDGRIQLRSTSTGKTQELVVKGWRELMGIDWAADGKSLLISWHWAQGPAGAGSGHRVSDSALLKVTLDGKASVLLRSSNEIWHAIPSPDGRLLAIAEAGGPKNVWQIEDF